jgi:hypothetical protein
MQAPACDLSRETMLGSTMLVCLPCLMPDPRCEGTFPLRKGYSMRRVKGFEESLLNLVGFRVQTRITLMYARSCM